MGDDVENLYHIMRDVSYLEKDYKEGKNIPIENIFLDHYDSIMSSRNSDETKHVDAFESKVDPDSEGDLELLGWLITVNNIRKKYML